MNIYESLENLNVSEECFNDIMGIVEEIINELKAPTPETAKAVFDRKAKRLEKSTNKFKDYKEFLNRPLRDTVSPTKKVSYIIDLAKGIGEQSDSLHQEGGRLVRGGERLYNWARKKGEKGKLTRDMADSAENMDKNVRENRRTALGCY